VGKRIEKRTRAGAAWSRVCALVGRRERYLWIGALALVAIVQWPLAKGFYYRATGVPAPAGSIAWRSDLDGALAEARRTHRQVLVDFNAGWCPPCLAMKHEVWPSAEVGAAVNASFVPLAIDVDKDTAVAARYSVDGIPVVMILDGDGRVIRQASGYLPISGVLRFLAESR
jgi:thiol:disulfide interchange protein